MSSGGVARWEVRRRGCKKGSRVDPERVRAGAGSGVLSCSSDPAPNGGHCRSSSALLGGEGARAGAGGRRWSAA
eukprot:12470911-Alexandrium_andersonii.AAC.1